MTLRSPLVLNNGQIQQLQAGDTLNASVSGGENYVLTNNETGSVVICTAVYLQANDAFKKAVATASGTSRSIGLVADASIANGVAGNVKLNGVLSASTAQWDAVASTSGGLTSGTIYYLSAATAGFITATPPGSVGQYVQEVGLALSTTELLLLSRDPILL